MGGEGRAEMEPMTTVWDASRLRVRVRFAERRRAVLSITGEVDASTGERLGDVGEMMSALDIDSVVVDTSDVTFVDSAGWRRLRSLTARLRAVGMAVEDGPMSSVVRRLHLLTITGTLR